MKIKKSYIPVGKKKEIANEIVMLCVNYNDGFAFIDYVNKDLFVFAYALEEYTGEKFDKDIDVISEKYDELKGDCGVRALFAETDYAELCHVVDGQFKMVEQTNSIERSAAKVRDMIISSGGQLLESVVDKINEFDTDVLKDANIKEIMSVLEKLK